MCVCVCGRGGGLQVPPSPAPPLLTPSTAATHTHTHRWPSAPPPPPFLLPSPLWQNNNRIRVVAPNGTVSTFAGTGSTTPFADGPATSATFYRPYGIAVGALGEVYVADYVRGGGGER